MDGPKGNIFWERRVLNKKSSSMAFAGSCSNTWCHGMFKFFLFLFYSFFISYLLALRHGQLAVIIRCFCRRRLITTWQGKHLYLWKIPSHLFQEGKTIMKYKEVFRETGGNSIFVTENGSLFFNWFNYI